MLCRSLFRIVAACFAVAAPLSGFAPAAEIAGWGTIVDPDGDCQITQAASAKVEIRIPATRHDMWFGGKDERTRFNAPRVVKFVEGDFIATVQVTADWNSGLAEGGYNGAGLVVWESEKQYLRYERNRFIPLNSTTPYTYVTPFYDQNDRRVFWSTTTKEYFSGGSTWLRIRRTGDSISTSYHDGKDWVYTGVVSTQFPSRVQVGIIAVNSTKREFAVEFQSLKIERP